jgi:CDP-diacylglycerol---glycerol-3-phosphate 3-phosphatidyltransferase
MRDIYFSAGMVGLLGAGLLLYGVRALFAGRARHERVEQDGGSAFVGKRFMEFGYWLIGPVVTLLDRWGATPNGVTVFSIVPAAAAGVAAALGWFGFACFLATTAAFADIIDGLLARRQGVASDAGEVLDAAVDRYSEGFFLAGLLIHYRASIALQVLISLALVGGFMVSYVTVKAEAMAVTAPRGSMRRSERAIYLFFGAGFTPLGELLAGPDLPLGVRDAPMLFALVVVALVSNVSVVRRVRAVVAAIRQREAGRAPRPGLASPPLAPTPIEAAAENRSTAIPAREAAR